MQNENIKNPGQGDEGIDDEDRDEKRMILSGAGEAGYHPPSREDINDIRKNHDAATVGVSADEAIRRVHGTAEPGVDDEALEKAIEGSSAGSGEGVERGDEREDENAA